MTKPINIYLQSRINEKCAFNYVACHSSGKAKSRQTKEREIESLKIFADALVAAGTSLEMMDGFFYEYHLPQLGKEFDLLKLAELECLNVELKSEAVPHEQMQNQLKKNKYYLSHFKGVQRFYTVVTDTMTCYMLDDEGELQPVALSDIANVVKHFPNSYLSEIDSMFRASNYLVSPLNTPEKFIRGEYFLTRNQEEIKHKILNAIYAHSGYGYFSLTGKPGTGKTLLLYDIAKQLSAVERTLVIHCGKLPDSHGHVKKVVGNFCLASTGCLKHDPEIVDDFHFILVDEAQRLYPHHYKAICKKIESDNKICIFSFDPEQVLSKAEKRNGIVQKIDALPLIGKYKLSEKIRTNKELASFIILVRNLKNKPDIPMDYSNVTLAYANNLREACRIIRYFRNQGYIFINYSKSNYNSSPYEKYEEEDYDTHHVIGQEFDKVLMVMDDSFYYDEDGVLQGVPHPNPDYLYPNLFYQGITRVREKIALVIVDSPQLFEKIASIFTIEQGA